MRRRAGATTPRTSRRRGPWWTRTRSGG
uniref:PIN9 n=1 Tax=Arundo donax TaxID=35708 RepID=A0A0A9BPU1_ARUDO